MCKARRVNDQYHCHACGFQWDVDDEDRPMCKLGNGVRGVALALALCVAGAASATDCDGTRVGELTRQTVAIAEVCLVTVQQVGMNVGGQTVECQAARDTSLLQNAEVQRMADAGCTTYYNGPSRAELARLGDLALLFKTARR
jgi:hypothetical protein